MPGRSGPRTGPQPELPPELRYEMPLPRSDERNPQFPSNDRPSRRASPIASRSVNRPAAVIEALKREAEIQASPEDLGGELSPAPRTLPRDHGHAEPLLQTPSDEPLNTPPADAALPPRGSLGRLEPRGGFNSRTQWSPARNLEWRADTHSRAIETTAAAGSNEEYEPNAEDPTIQQTAAVSPYLPVSARLSAMRAAAWQDDHQDAPKRADFGDDDDSQTSLPLASQGLNTPAAVPAGSNTTKVRRESRAADLTISPPASSARLAVRSIPSDGWGHTSAVKNPLRATGAIKVSFDEDRTEKSIDERSEPVGRYREQNSAIELEMPRNPLR